MKHNVCSIGELSPNRPKAVLIGKKKIAIVATAEGIQAIANVCSHQYLPLDNGVVENANIRCRYHGATFSLVDGSLVYSAGFLGLTGVSTYTTEVIGDRVWVEIPDET